MISLFLDFLFPPLCIACKEPCTTKSLCPECWIRCQLPDPAERCRHCFNELDERGNLCSRCRQGLSLSAVRATVFDPDTPAYLLGVQHIAPFALMQWVQLEWPMPDAIIPMPDSDSQIVAKELAILLDCPYIKALWANCEYKEDRLDEDLHLLLIDSSNPLEKLKTATEGLSESFPKRIFLLTLFPYDYSLS